MHEKAILVHTKNIDWSNSLNKIYRIRKCCKIIQFQNNHTSIFKLFSFWAFSIYIKKKQFQKVDEF